MPLPFSFSTPRYNPESETPAEQAGEYVAEKVMQAGPGLVSTEPLLGTPGNTFSPPSKTPESWGRIGHPKPAFSESPVSPSPLPAYPYFGPSRNTEGNVALVATQPVTHSPNSAMAGGAPSPPDDFGAQTEQLRNDVFGVAMGVSALSDRLDRLEERLSDEGAQARPDIGTLRREVEMWLQNHLSSAVEHCIQQIMARNHSTTAPPSNQTPALQPTASHAS